MARFTFGLLVGLAATAVCTLVLWLTLPFVFSGVTSGPDVWLGWFPFAIFAPAVLLGGFTAARYAPVRRTVLGFAVGLTAAGLAALLARGTGHVLFLLVVLFISGLLGALGARLARKNDVSV